MSDAADHRRPWRPSPLLLGTFGVHAGAAAALVAAPGQWPAIAGALVANHALLTAAGLWPRSRVLGPNLVRLPSAAAARGEVALTIDDGPDPDVTPAVLEQLAARGARATFFCIGELASRHPQLCAEIVRRGHAVENHSQHHAHHFSLLGPMGFAREIGSAQATLSALSGSTPRFFRAPAGLRNPLLEPVLARLGLHLASWTRRGFDTVTRDPATVLGRLTRDLAPGDILLLHDGHAARTQDRVPVVLEVLPRLLDAFEARGLRTVTLREGAP